MTDWRVLILTYLVFRFFGTVVTLVEIDGVPLAPALGFTVGVMWIPFLVSALVGWFLKRGDSPLLDWKAFSLTYLVLSFVGQTGFLINDGMPAFSAMREVAGPMILSLVAAMLVVWLVRRRREVKREVKEKGTTQSKIEPSENGFREKGWKPLPTLLKVIVVILTLSLLSVPLAFVGPFGIYGSGYPFLGFIIFGSGAVFLSLIFGVGGTSVLLYAILKRSNWTWKYCVALYGFYMLNGLLAVPRILEIPEMGLYIGGLAGILGTLLTNVVLLAVFFRKRAYFK